MHYGKAALVRSRLAEPGTVEQLRQRMAADTAAFRDGLAVVEAYGRLTPRGAAIMADAARYMREAA
jgi:hypothetical protein